MALRSWFGPRRRLRFTRGGWLFTGGTLALGLAAVGTGNNLLFLLLGAMLGFIVLSGWLSEQMLRGCSVRRLGPARGVAGQPIVLAYRVHNGKRRVPTLVLELAEAGAPERAFLSAVLPGRHATARIVRPAGERGVYPLTVVRLITSFPFGLFEKERQVSLDDRLIIHPRTNRPGKQIGSEPSAAASRPDPVSVAGVGERGEYRGLREYRPGDDPRDVHWRSSARVGRPLIREYDRARTRPVRLRLDTGRPPGTTAELALEETAGEAARLVRQGRPVALDLGERSIPPGRGPAHLNRLLDALASVRFRGRAE